MLPFDLDQLNSQCELWEKELLGDKLSKTEDVKDSKKENSDDSTGLQ